LVKTCQIGLDGNDLDDDTTSTKKRKVNRYAGYTDMAWGVKTRGWVAATKRLDKDKWKSILQAAVDRIDSAGDEGDLEEGANGGAIDPRALIEI
jgi:hypothetical protein